MYGTVMIATMAQGMTLGDYDVVSKEWLMREVDGFVDEQVMATDDGRIVIAVRFRDKACYDALSNSPEQDEFYTSRFKPLIEGEPEWIDGEWVAHYLP